MGIIWGQIFSQAPQTMQSPAWGLSVGRLDLAAFLDVLAAKKLLYWVKISGMGISLGQTSVQ